MRRTARHRRRVLASMLLAATASACGPDEAAVDDAQEMWTEPHECAGMTAARVHDYAAGGEGAPTPEGALANSTAAPARGEPKVGARSSTEVRFDYFDGEEFTGDVRVTRSAATKGWRVEYDTHCFDPETP